MLPIEIQELINKQKVIISQCDGELQSLEQAVANWKAMKARAQATITALEKKWSKPDLSLWPVEKPTVETS